MSYSCWTVDGYGICVDKLTENNDLFIERLLKLMEQAPEIKSDFEGFIHDNEFETIDMDVFDEYGRNIDHCNGLASLLRGIIEEIEGISLIDCDDFNDYQYLLYGPSYPWTIPEKERNLTKESVTDMFNKYIDQLTDKPVLIDYYSVENGG